MSGMNVTVHLNATEQDCLGMLDARCESARAMLHAAERDRRAAAMGMCAARGMVPQDIRDCTADGTGLLVVMPTPASEVPHGE